MPRRPLKRNIEVANNDDDASSSEPSAPPTRRHRRDRSSSASSGAASPASPSVSPDEDPGNGQTQPPSASSDVQVLVKKLVRLALSAEYARQPLRRGDIAQKILRDNNATHRLFRPVFEGAQRVLQHTFGMALVELPTREKTTLKDRRAQTQTTQTQNSTSSSGAATANKSWILVSTLPAVYKQNPEICPPARAASREAEAEYTALYTLVVSLIYLNNAVLTDAKLERYLKRVNADTYTPAGATDKLLLRMAKEGYIEKRRDMSSGEEVVEWVVGPRGKVEVGVRGVASLVKGVYGFGGRRRSRGDEGGAGSDGEEAEGANGGGVNNQVKIEEEDLDRRLERSLGIKIASKSEPEQQQQQQQQQQPEQMEVDGVEETSQRRRRGRPRKNNAGSDDD